MIDRTGKFNTPVCVVCSSGGHLAEALAAIRKVEIPHYFIAFEEPHVRSRLENREVYFIVDPHKSVYLYLKNAWQSLIIFMRKRPRVIISTGAGIALATLLLGWALGSTIIFIETGARVTVPSRTGRFVYRFADIFIVQWESLLRHYPNAVYGGALL